MDVVAPPSMGRNRQVPGQSTLLVLRLAPTMITLGSLGLSLMGRPGSFWWWALGIAISLLPLLGRDRPLLVMVLLDVALVASRVDGIKGGVVVVVPVVAVWLVDLAPDLRGRRLALGIALAALAIGLSLVSGLPDPKEPRIWFAVVGFLAITTGIPMLIGLNLRSARLAAQRAEDRAAEVERRRASETKAVRAEERTAIARELHDLVAHHVASIVLRVGVARHLVGDRDPRATEALDDVHATGGAVLGDLRRLVTVLRDPETAGDDARLLHPRDLPDCLAKTITRSRQAGLTVTSSLDPVVAGLDAVRGLTVLRVVQEGLTNVLKHAGPGASATVRVASRADEVRVEVSNDGAGRRPELTASGGHGLTGLRERVDLVGGTLDAGPLDSGWRVSARLPATDGPGAAA